MTHAPEPTRDNLDSRPITPNAGYQLPPFEGWGTTLAWFAHATGDYPEAVRERLFQLVFGSEGLNLNIARYNIGGGNAPDVPSSYMRLGGDVPGWWRPTIKNNGSSLTASFGNRDEFLSRWDPEDADAIDPDADQSQRWWVQRLADADQITHWEAFSNSPPFFMTTSGYVTGGHADYVDQIREDAVEPFVGYLVRVVEALERAHGIKFHSIDPLNEPRVTYWKTDLAGDGTPRSESGQEGSQVSPPLQGKVLEALARRLERSDTTTTAIVSGPDETNPIDFFVDWNGWSDQAREDVAQLNVHTYETDGTALVRDIAKQTGKPLWMSEVEGHWGSGFAPDDITHGLGLARRIISDLRELEPSAWVLWQAVEDLLKMERDDQGWGEIFIDFDLSESGHSARRSAAEAKADAREPWQIITNTKFAVMRQFTRAIRPGDVQIAVSDEDTVAFLSPGSGRLTLVHVNATPHTRRISIDLKHFATTGDATAEAASTVSARSGEDSSASSWCDVVTSTGPVDSMSVPGHSVTTLVVKNVGEPRAGSVPLDGKTRLLPVTGTPDPLISEHPWDLETVSGANTNRRVVTLRRGDQYLSGSPSGAVDVLPREAGGGRAHEWVMTTTDGVSYSLLNLEAGRQLQREADRVVLAPSSLAPQQQWLFSPA